MGLANMFQDVQKICAMLWALSVHVQAAVCMLMKSRKLFG